MTHDVAAWKLAGIFFTYLVIAGQFAWYVKHLHTKESRAVFYMVGIFTLCGVSGYAGPLFHLPVWFLDASHFVLLVFAVLFVVTNQVKLVASLLKGH